MSEDISEERRKLELPDRRKNTYEELSQRVDEHVEYLEGRLRRFFIKALLAFAVLGLTSAGSLLGFGFVLSQQADTSSEIQKQRFNTILENCKNQNERHDRAIAKSESQIGLDRQSKKIVRLLADELQPRVDNCEAYANNRVKGRS